MKPKQIKQNLRDVSDYLRGHFVPCVRKHTKRGVPFVQSCFGHRIVLFGNTGVYRMFMPTKYPFSKQEKIDFNERSALDNAEKIVKAIRENARENYAITPFEEFTTFCPLTRSVPGCGIALERTVYTRRPWTLPYR